MQVEKVYLVFKTHFDIGFTAMAKDVLRLYSGEMLEKVVTTCEETQKLGNARYVWTVPAWPMQVMERDCTPELRKRMRALIHNGQLAWHALPFTTHYDFSGLEDAIEGLQYAKELAEEHHKPLVLAGKMTDVPGAGWMLPEILAEAGIKFLHMGCNEFASPPDVPPLFWWEAPSGKRVLVMYNKLGYGTPLCPPEGWPYAVWMSLMNTQDNCGPQSTEVLEKLVSAVHAEHPGAEVVSGTLDDFWQALSQQDLSNLPVVRKDLADTWIHGVASYPKEVAMVREARRRLRTVEMRLALDGRTLSLAARDKASRCIRTAYDGLALFAEHTWGLDVKSFLGAIPDYQRDAFAKYRLTEKCATMEASWQEQAERARSALAACEEAEAAVGVTRASQTPTRPAEPCLNGVVEGGRYRLELNPATGIIDSLYDKQNECLLLQNRDGHGAIHYRYDRYGTQEMTEYVRAYGYRFSDWGVLDNARRGYPECEHLTRSPTFVECLRDGSTVLLRYQTVGEQQHTGDAAQVELLIDVPADMGEVSISVRLIAKPATPYVESGELVMELASENPRYFINKPGCVLNPETDIADGANHVYYALENFAAAQVGNALAVVASRDCPLLSIGENGVYGYRQHYQKNAADLRFCLFNNMWGTNFPQWIEGDLSFGFKVFAQDSGRTADAYEEACEALDGAPIPALPFTLPAGVRVTRLIPDGDALLFHLHSMSDVPIVGELVFPGKRLRREDLLGRPITDWACERVPLAMNAYAVACYRAE